MEIETALAKASLTRVEKRDPYKLFHKLPRAEFLALTPTFGWAAYWNAIGLAAPDVVNVTEPEFYKEVERQLATRPIGDWKIYLRWHVARAKAPFLSSAFVQANFDFFSKYLRGVTEMQPRWKRCVRYVDEDLGEALGQVFVEKTFTADTKARALTMVKQIEQAMETDLNQIAWMSADTKKLALAKLHSVVNKIGYPDKWRDYSAVNVVRGDFLGNVDRAAVFESKRQLDEDRQARGPHRMGHDAAHRERLLRPADERHQLPGGRSAAAALRSQDGRRPELRQHRRHHRPRADPRLRRRRPPVRRQGQPERLVDQTGRRRFEKRTACVVDQYAQYTVVDDIKINSKLTLGEDVADLGGTLLAYMAWKDATKGQDLKPIDGFTPDQRFFIGMAQWACGDERPENKRMNAITNPHSPDEYRINGVVCEHAGVSKAFSCKAGQPMAPVKACRVW